MKLVRYQNHPLVQAFDDIDRVFSGPFEGFGRLFDLAGRLGAASYSGGHGRHGSSDLYEDDQNYYVRADLPGVKKEDLKLELHDGTLVLAFEGRQENGDTRSAVACKKAVSVPEGVDAGLVSAKLEDGVLTVTLPKSEERKPRPIAIG